MIVTDTRPANSNSIINNKAVISTIRLTSSYVGGKPHLLILISYNSYYTTYNRKKQANKTKNKNLLINYINYSLLILNLRMLYFGIVC